MHSLKANLEMNKEGLAADLVCMLDERSLPRNKARLQELIERFFIAGAARIDLIAKVIDLDNDIGGYKFDIANLQETANEIENIGKSRGKGECSVIISLSCPLYTTIHAVFSHFVTSRKSQNYIFEYWFMKIFSNACSFREISHIVKST